MKDFCNGVRQKANSLDMTVIESVTITSSTENVKVNLTEIGDAMARYRAKAEPAVPTSEAIDAIVGCTYFDSCIELLRLTSESKGEFSVKAMAFTNCLTDPKWKKVYATAGDLAIAMRYAIGIMPWDENSDVIDETMLTERNEAVWSPSMFAKQYIKQFGGGSEEPPPYHAAANFACGMLLVRAMETCECVEPDRIARALNQLARENSTQTVFGQVLLDENRQNSVLLSPLQFINENVIRVNATNVVIPMPTWAMRECEFKRGCEDFGGCLSNGECRNLPCSPGEFNRTRTSWDPNSDNSQDYVCERCNPGYFKATKGMRECEPCALGLYQPEYRMSTCFSCNQFPDFEHAYQNTAAATTCIACPQLTQRRPGTKGTAADDCLYAPFAFQPCTSASGCAAWVSATGAR
jgi:hypothetical protein